MTAVKGCLSSIIFRASLNRQTNVRPSVGSLSMQRTSIASGPLPGDYAAVLDFVQADGVPEQLEVSAKSGFGRSLRCPGKSRDRDRCHEAYDHDHDHQFN